MQKLDLYVYRSNFFALLELVHLPAQYSTQSALNTLNLEEIVLIEWRGRITPQQILTWQLRTHQKKYAVKLAVSVAVALWQVLQRIKLSPDLQELLSELDRSLVEAGLSTKFLSYSIHD